MKKHPFVKASCQRNPLCSKVGSMILWLVLWGLLGLFPAHAQPDQWVIEGKVINAATGQPIAYANIGIVGQQVGTLSNSDGSFSVHLSEKYGQEVLTVAALGFQSQMLAITALRKQRQNTIYLEEKVYPLAEVVIRSKPGKSQEATLGISRRNGGTYSGNDQTAGAAMAIRLQAETVPFQVGKARLRLLYNPFPDCKVRVRLLAVEPATGKPGKDLLEKSIIITTPIKKGWIEADLTEYKILIEDSSFFLAFEWIEDDKRRKATVKFWEAYQRDHPEMIRKEVRIVEGDTVETTISRELVKNTTMFATSSHPEVIAAYSCYTREASLAEWKRSSSVLVATATIIFP